MIIAIAAMALQTPRVVEMLEPSWGVVSIQAVVKLPPLSDRDTALVAQVVGALGAETAPYSGNQIADLAARAGSRVRATMMRDHIRVGMEVLPADEATGIGMIGAILRESVFARPKLEDIAQDLQFRRIGYWRQALEQYQFQPQRYGPNDISDLVGRLFRPENIAIAIGGRITPGLATKRWDELQSAWTMRRPAPATQVKQTDRSAVAISAALSILDFQGAIFSATDAAFATRLLALTALGTGKASSLWRVSREAMGASYRQEAVLYPTETGFQPRLVIAHAGEDGLDELGVKIRERLISDIAAWTDSDRKRAIGMAESYLTRGGELSLLYLSPGRPLDGDISDQTFLQAYWLIKTGSRWNPHQLVGKMGFVELQDLKATAHELMSGAKLVLHKGID